MGEDPTVRYAYQQIGVPERALSSTYVCCCSSKSCTK